MPALSMFYGIIVRMQSEKVENIVTTYSCVVWRRGNCSFAEWRSIGRQVP